MCIKKYVDKYLNGKIFSVDSAENRAAAYSDKFMIVESVGQILNSDGDAVPSIRGYWKKTHLAFPVKTGDEGVDISELNSLKKGDVILLKYDDKSNINFIKKCTSENGFSEAGLNTYQGQVVISGSVVAYDYEKYLLRFRYTQDGNEVCLDYLPSTTFYMYDMKNETYTISSPEEILPEDTVYVNTRYYRCYDVAIIRK